MENVVSSLSIGAGFVDRPNSQSSVKSESLITMNEFESKLANLSNLPDELKEHIEKAVKDFFGDSEFMYKTESDVNLIELLGFCPVQRLSQENIVNKIISTVSFGMFCAPMPFYGTLSNTDHDLVSHVDLLIHSVLRELEPNPPHNCI